MTIPRYRFQEPQYITQNELAGSYTILSTKIDVYTGGSGVLKSRYKQCWDELHPGPPYRSGGPLWMPRLEQKCPWSDSITLKRGAYIWTGRFRHSAINLQLDYDGMQPEAVDSGATAWNRFRPVKPRASMGQFLGELRDFSSLFKIRLKRFQDLGGQYLNYQFGWVPFINDLKKFINTQRKFEKYLSFARKNNGKWIQRGGTLKNVISTTESTQNCRVTPTLLTTFYFTMPNLTPTKCVETVSEHIWFKARMKYYIPDLSVDKAENMWSSRFMRKLYGLELTPELVWELTPWSWLVDWFGNVGDVMANISNQSYDNLVAKYAYVMRSYSRNRFYTTEMQFKNEVGACVPLRVSSYDIIECKDRGCASPYGFSIDWPDFTAYQLAILAALGVSRAPRI